MTFQELVEEVQSAGELKSQKEARRVVRVIISAVETALRTEGRIVLPGLGTFTVRDRPARRNMNLHTKKVEELPAKRVVRYRPAAELAKIVNESKQNQNKKTA